MPPAEVGKIVMCGNEIFTKLIHAVMHGAIQVIDRLYRSTGLDLQELLSSLCAKAMNNTTPSRRTLPLRNDCEAAELFAFRHGHNKDFHL